MANVQWQEIPFELHSLLPDGSGENTPVLFNTFLDGSTAGPMCLLDPDKCQAGTAKRVTRDNHPQRGGEILHKHFKTGFVIQVGGIYVNVDSVNACLDDDDAIVGAATANISPLCGADLVAMDDLLMLNLDAMENQNGKIIWFPSGYPKTVTGPPATVTSGRGLYQARWLGPDGLGGSSFTSVLTEREDQVFTAFQFAVVSPFPYVMDLEEIDTTLNSGTPVTVVQSGTTIFYPVIEVAASGGAVTTFTLSNSTVSQILSYDSGFPGAVAIPDGEFIEFDFFRNTAYRNGSGANAKAGIDILNSDFWGLVPGNNVIELAGTNAVGTMKWQAAYV